MVLSGVANIASKYECSNSCSFRDITFFVIFSKKFLQNLNEIFFFKIWISQPCIWGLSDYPQGLQALALIMIAQIFVVFEILRFL